MNEVDDSQADGTPADATAAPPPTMMMPPDEDENERMEAQAEIGMMGPGDEENNRQQEDIPPLEPEVTDPNGEIVKERFMTFLDAFHEKTTLEDPNDGTLHETDVYPYVDQAQTLARPLLSSPVNSATSDEDATQAPTSFLTRTLWVNFRHMQHHDYELAEAIQTEYLRFEPYLRQAWTDFLHYHHPALHTSAMKQLWFVAIGNLPQIHPLRHLKMEHTGTLQSVRATVTRTTEVRPELLRGVFRCHDCGLLTPPIPQQYHYTRPVLCRNPRCQNTRHFQLDTTASDFADWQKWRVQELSSEIPPGSMPRSLDVYVRGEWVEAAKAGDVCVLTGSWIVLPDGSALARAGETPQAMKRHDQQASGNNGVRGLKRTGVKELSYRTCFLVSSVQASTSNSTNNNQTLGPMGASLRPQTETAESVVLSMTAAQRQEIRELRQTPNLFEKLARSICPSTTGHLEIKKGLLLQLVGGVHKTGPDGIKLRGDVNVCIVGDPSTAKSQFLKYVHAFSNERSVYCVGKASSAAGLTAAVQRDPDTGEFGIEAGALLLADNGICCIDEFDKMDPNDQVAIHEAMEQQTISLTKAGIQATLNARASILAAANPVYGRYDRSKTLQANVALSAPILSRFDLFFVVLDDCNPVTDRRVAEHILKVHRCHTTDDDARSAPFSTEQMQRYIRFARTIHPKITPACQRVLVDCYRRLRQNDSFGASRSAYRITVRQLESLIRLSEAMARLHCDSEIQPAYVHQAFRLLKTSIIRVETSDVAVEDDDDDDDDDDNNNNNGGDNRPEGDAPLDDEEDDRDETQLPPEPLAMEQEPPPAKKQKKDKSSKKVKISFEEYQSMAQLIAAQLRSIESAQDDDDEPVYWKWNQVVEWYLGQIEQDLGNSLEALEAAKKKVNLVLRRLISVDHVLVTVGPMPTDKSKIGHTLLAVHPNYAI